MSAAGRQSTSEGRIPLEVRLRILGGQSAVVRRGFRLALRVREHLYGILQAGYVARLGPRVTIETTDGKIRLDLTALRDFRLYLRFRKGGSAEAATTALLRDSLRPGMVFVDAGANNGLFTLVAARCVGPSGRVYAFEPHPATFERLRANVELNDLSQVTPFQLALSDSSGEATLFGRADDGENTLHAEGGPGTSVAVAPFDRVLPGVHVDVVKMDVEGSELSALRGMRSMLAASPDLRLLVEWNRDYATAELFRFLTARFRVEVVHEASGGSWALRPALSPAEFPSLCNLWCTPR